MMVDFAQSSKLIVEWRLHYAVKNSFGHGCCYAFDSHWEDVDAQEGLHHLFGNCGYLCVFRVKTKKSHQHVLGMANHLVAPSHFNAKTLPRRTSDGNSYFPAGSAKQMF